MANEELLVPTFRSKSVYEKLVNKRIVFLGEDITADTATEIAATLLWLDSESKEEIALYINSPGGDIENGLLTVYDTMQFIKSDLKTIAIGRACSAAAVLLSAGTKGKRLSYPHAQIMIHGVQVGGELYGDANEFRKESKQIDKLNHSLMEILAKHTGQPIKKVKRDCKGDKILTPQEALEYGIIDEIYGVPPILKDSNIFP